MGQVNPWDKLTRGTEFPEPADNSWAKYATLLVYHTRRPSSIPPCRQGHKDGCHSFFFLGGGGGGGGKDNRFSTRSSDPTRNGRSFQMP